MLYRLTGFTNDLGFRVFLFEDIPEDLGRGRNYFVRADLALTRKYRIPLQELPLLCCEILQQRTANDDTQHTFTCTEDDMSTYARDAARAEERKPETHTQANDREAGTVTGIRTGVSPHWQSPNTREASPVQHPDEDFRGGERVISHTTLQKC